MIVEKVEKAECLIESLLGIASLYYKTNDKFNASLMINKAIGYISLISDEHLFNHLFILKYSQNLMNVAEMTHFFMELNTHLIHLCRTGSSINTVLSDILTFYSEVKNNSLLVDLASKSKNKDILYFIFDSLANRVSSEEGFNWLLSFLDKVVLDKDLISEIINVIVMKSIGLKIDLRKTFMGFAYRYAFQPELFINTIGYLLVNELSDPYVPPNRKTMLVDWYHNLIDLSIWELPSSQHYSYAALENWIDSLDDEDNKAMVQIMATKVKKGKISKEQFERDVATLLG